jgi:hypothetical protein
VECNNIYIIRILAKLSGTVSYVQYPNPEAFTFLVSPIKAREGKLDFPIFYSDPLCE